MAMGRKMQILKGATVLAAISSKTFKFNFEGIEITTDDDNGFRRYAAEPGSKSLDVDWEGLLLSDTTNPLITIGIHPTASRLITDLTLKIVEFNILIACDFWFDSVELGGEMADAIKASGGFKSSGPWTVTDGVNP